MTAIPKTGKPPVVFVNGYQGSCTDVSFAGTFATADQVMQRDGRVSLFFNNCSVGGNNTAIEDLGKAFGEFLGRLRYQDGETVPQVDVVAHSMGGLIVRSYLAGKQPGEGVFTPPPQVPIRKAVFLATPHFGTPVASRTNDRQGEQLALGSDFVVDLATWNQGQDDLRGVDYIGVLGNAGTEAVRLLGIDWRTGFHDSTVSLMSASLDFTPVVERNRILPYCHTGGIALAACSNSTRIAAITSDQHDTARILLSFLNGTEEWRSIGQSLLQNPYLSQQAGLVVRWRDANDQAITPSAASVRAQGSTGEFEDLERRGPVAFDELLPARSYDVRLTSSSATLNSVYEPTRGAFRAVTFKTGPSIAAVAPVFRPVFPRAVAPGMFISIYGTLASAIAAAEAQPYPTTLAETQVLLADRPLPLHYVSPQQINAVLPDDVSGLIKLTVRTPAGRHTLNVLVEEAVPSVFASAVNAQTGALITPAAPAKPGEYLSVYLTGLGATERRDDGLDWARRQPTVLLGSQPCSLLYAGRSPGYVGLDQINCRVPEDASAGDLALTVRSGSRVSSPIVVPVR